MATSLPWSRKYCKGKSESVYVSRICRAVRTYLGNGDTSVDGGFTSSHRHVGGVGNEGRSLHDGLFLAVDVDSELEQVSISYTQQSNFHTSGKSIKTSAISFPRSPQPT